MSEGVILSVVGHDLADVAGAKPTKGSKTLSYLSNEHAPSQRSNVGQREARQILDKAEGNN